MYYRRPLFFCFYRWVSIYFGVSVPAFESLCASEECFDRCRGQYVGSGSRVYLLRAPKLPPPRLVEFASFCCATTVVVYDQPTPFLSGEADIIDGALYLGCQA